MNEMRHKLNDHIVYLQNEIRKRDELLEGQSDFEDETMVEDSSVGQGSFCQDQSVVQDKPKKHKKTSVSREILEEARSQIKLLLESKI